MSEAPPPRRKKKRKLVKFLIFLLVLGAIGALVYFNLKKEKPEETFPTTAVLRGNLIHKLAETGSIELVRTVEVKSTIAGRIEELPIQAGDSVEEGQLLAVIEPDPDQSLQMMRGRSAVERSQLNLREQQRDVTRKKALRERNMLSSKDLEDAEMRLTRARNDLRLAKLELEVLQTKADPSRTSSTVELEQMDEIRVFAPITGIVILRGVEIGEVVASGLSAFSGGTILFEIGDPSRMIVRGDIAEIDIGKLEVGQEVDVVVDAYPDTTYRGRVRWIAPVGLKKQGSPIVTFDTEIDILDNDPRLRQGLSCDLDIIFTRRDSVLYLPIETVLEIFDTEDGEEESTKGRRGRFVVYAVRPDSAAADTTSADTAEDSMAATADTAAQSFASVSDSLAPGADAMARLASTNAALSNSAFASATDTLATSDSAVVALADTVASADSAVVLADSSAADTLAAEEGEPAGAVLEAFVEIELQVGLETSTRIEILAGLEEGDLVAADPEQIKQKLEQKAKGPDEDDDD